MISEHDIELAEEFAKYYADPLGFVMFAYPWDTDESIQVCELVEPWASIYGCKYGPDEWSCEFLDDLGKEIAKRRFDGKTAVKPIRFATTSGHGIGKSAMTGWLTDFILKTRPNSQGTVTANTGPQLESKTWPQIIKWFNKSQGSHWFNVTSGRGSMKIVHKYKPETWFCTAQTCREENSEAFAGQHAVNSTSFYINDESSAISDKIFEVQEGGLTDGEPMQFLFGNPTKNTGRLKEAFGKLRHRYNCYQIDSRDVQITNKDFLQELIDDYGEDSDIVRIRVKGQFPKASFNQLIPEDIVENAKGKVLHPSVYSHAPRVLTCDPARFGDDQTVIGERHGLMFKIHHKFREKDTMFVASRIGHMQNENNYDAIFIDEIGIGAGIVDRLRQLGHKNVIPVNVAKNAINEKEYFNLRTECWFNVLEWLNAGGCLPDDREICDDLTAVEYGYDRKNRKQLESKDDTKKRLNASPDCGDCLAISFAQPVNITKHIHEPKAVSHVLRKRMQSRKKRYKVFAHIGG